MKITKYRKAVDVLRLSNNVIKVFREHDLYCPGCMIAGEETIDKNSGLKLNGCAEIYRRAERLFGVR